MILSIDIETRSRLDLAEVGAWKYAADPSTEVLCCAYKFQGAPVEIIRCFEGEAPPARVVEHIASGGIVSAFNIAFDATVLNSKPVYGFPEINPEQMLDTMARAANSGLLGSLEANSGLFGSLDDVLQMLGCKNQKDKEGKKVMLKMCKPGRKGEFICTPELLQKLYAYCINDVVVESQLLDILPPLPKLEQWLWEQNYRANCKGVPINLHNVNKLNALVQAEKERANLRIAELTGCKVNALDEHKNLKEWLNYSGVRCESTDKAAVDEMLGREDIPLDCREVLEIRKAAGVSSTAKLETMVAAEVNGNLHGVTAYYAANTGRYGGRLVQLQNLPRGKYDKTQHEENIRLIEALGNGTAEQLDDIPARASGAIRAMIEAPGGYKLVSADYSNIEGRVLSWLANEKWRLDAFRAADSGEAKDMYVLSYQNAFGVSYDEAKASRQLGKIMELASGYGGSVGAYRKMGGAQVDALDDDEIKTLVTKWRAASPAIVKLWRSTHDAAVKAIQFPLVESRVNNKNYFMFDGTTLKHYLPNNRAICYFAAQLEAGKYGEQIIYIGRDSVTKKICTQRTYGGSLVQGAVQGIARDILCAAIWRLERAWWDVRFSVHDELNCLEPEGGRSVQELISIMKQLPPWAEGLPIAAAGWEGKHYRK